MAFLGNAHDKTVEKLKPSITPSVEQIDSVVDKFSKISEAALEEGVQVVLIMGPNKSSIYPEYLPYKINPSTVKYSSFFIDKLKELPNLTIYDPTRDLLNLKSTEVFCIGKLIRIGITRVHF